MTTTRPRPARHAITLAVIPGDGIGPEVVAEAPQGPRGGRPPVKFETTRYDLGAERYLATGEVLPDAVLEEIRGHDAILLGAVGGKPGDPNLPPGILERGLLLRLRFELDHYVNLRPSRIFPGVRHPAGRQRAGQGRGRLRRRPRGHRGSLHRQRRRPARRHAGRDRHRGQRQHRVRRRARRPRRLRPGPAPAAQEADPGPQDQRPRARRRRVVADRRRGRARSSPTSRSTTSTSTPRRSSSAPTPRAST